VLAASLAGWACASGVSPVSRVVELLSGMSKKVEEEGKMEEKLYKKFKCWGTTNVDEKTASNAAATSRVDELKTYIADIEAGRIEFTTERIDLEKEIAQLNKDLATAQALREQEKSDFEAAKVEMEQAVSALGEAVSVLEAGAAAPSLVTMKRSKAHAALGLEARAAKAVIDLHAVELAGRILSKGDALFLRRALLGEVQPKDWKKLNRKAAFKLPYAAQSGKIKDTLAALLQTFEKNLEEATAKEEAAESMYGKLSGAKGEQKSKAQEALTSAEMEGGARGLNKEQAQAEVDDLEAQIVDDTKYIKEIKATLKTKDEEYSERTTLRAQELEAISKAIGVLHSDDARDLFKKSISSQGYSFLQVRRQHATMMESRGITAAAVLRQTSAKVHDARLTALASRLSASEGKFDEVITHIEEMVTMLKEEETTELETKETCESERAKDVKDAQVASRAADDLTDTKTRLEEEITEVTTEIAAKEAEIKDIEEQLKDATRIREDEEKGFSVAKLDDEAAVGLIEKAHDVLMTFYSAQASALETKSVVKTQQKQKQAPPPPPATWDASASQTKNDESQGILSLLTMIKTDIENDIKKATDAEDASVAAYDTMKTDLEKSIEDTRTTIGTLEETKSSKETDVQAAEEEHATKKEELKTILDKIKAEQPGCDFMLVNYPTRVKNRQMEIDGLDKAKAILKGAEFSL